MSIKTNLEKCDNNDIKIKLIKNIIDSEYTDLIQNRIYLETENRDKEHQENQKVLLSGGIFEALELKLYKVTADMSTEEIPKETAVKFIDEFKDNFGEYLRPIRIHSKLLKKWFISDKIDVYLTQNGTNIIFYVKQNGIHYQISDTTSDNNIITQDDMRDFSRQYESIFGKQIDGYIKGIKISSAFKNTRKFEIGKVIFSQFEDAFKHEQDTCILCIPAIIMDDRDPDYENRLTFVLAIGRYSVQESIYKIISDRTLYDRNGLCPPPDGSNC